MEKTIIFACIPYWYKFLSNKEQPEHSSFKFFTHENNSNPYERFHIQHVWIFFYPYFVQIVILDKFKVKNLNFDQIWQVKVWILGKFGTSNLLKIWFLNNLNLQNSWHQCFANSIFIKINIQAISFSFKLTLENWKTKKSFVYPNISSTENIWDKNIFELER